MLTAAVCRAASISSAAPSTPFASSATSTVTVGTSSTKFSFSNAPWRALASATLSISILIRPEPCVSISRAISSGVSRSSCSTESVRPEFTINLPTPVISPPVMSTFPLSTMSVPPPRSIDPVRNRVSLSSSGRSNSISEVSPVSAIATSKGDPSFVSATPSANDVEM